MSHKWLIIVFSKGIGELGDRKMNDNDAWRRVSIYVSPKKRRTRFLEGGDYPFCGIVLF